MIVFSVFVHLIELCVQVHDDAKSNNGYNKENPVFKILTEKSLHDTILY